jgi:hypothetical protein
MPSMPILHVFNFFLWGLVLCSLRFALASTTWAVITGQRGENGCSWSSPTDRGHSRKVGSRQWGHPRSFCFQGKCQTDPQQPNQRLQILDTSREFFQPIPGVTNDQVDAPTAFRLLKAAKPRAL